MSHAPFVAAAGTARSDGSSKHSKANGKSPEQRKNVACSKNTKSATLSYTTMTTVPAEDSSTEKRRKAAAAARRRRRKITMSRRQHNSPRSVSRVFSGPSLSGLGQSNGGNSNQSDNTDSASSCLAAAAVPKTPVKKIRSTVEGMAEVADRWRSGEIVALPTECTYEACVSLQLPTNEEIKQGSAVTPPDWAYRIERVRQATTRGSRTAATFTAAPSAPYCWVPRTGDCMMLRDCFPARTYAMRDTSGRAQIAHRFNETHEVIIRIARQVWPGPVTLHVALPHSGSGNATGTGSLRSFWSVLATAPEESAEGRGGGEQPGPHTGAFLALRCPRHPLAVKAATEHSKEPGCEQKKPKHEASRAVLVGFPVLKQPAAPDLNYCTTSGDVQTASGAGGMAGYASAGQPITAVLDGEDQSELFAVPTCEYRKPWHHQVWVNGQRRTITLVCSDASVGDGDGRAADAGESFAAGPGSETLTSPSSSSLETRLKNALRQRVPNRPPLSKPKERILQAVLSKWVVEQTPGLSDPTEV